MHRLVFEPNLIRFRYLVLGLILMSIGVVDASMDVYEFESEAQQQQYQVLIQELRCPKCQNQNIADSNAPLAQDLRRKVHQQILEGRSQQQIVQYMVERYGDFVTYKPPLKPVTYILWFGPFLGVGLALTFLVLRVRRHAHESASPLSPAEQAALAKILSPLETQDVDE